jgi:hypothetical protein
MKSWLVRDARRNPCTPGRNFSTAQRSFGQLYRFDAIYSFGRLLWMFSVYVRPERFGTLPLIVPLHFINRATDQWS